MLTHEQIDLAIQQHVDPVATYGRLHNFARAIEAEAQRDALEEAATAVEFIGCGHGVLFVNECVDCEIVGLIGEYKRAVKTVARVRDRLRVLGAPMPGQTSAHP